MSDDERAELDRIDAEIARLERQTDMIDLALRIFVLVVVLVVAFCLTAAALS